MKILIVDDELHCRNVIRKLVAECGQSIGLIQEADSVEEAVKKINEFRPDLVFLDIRLHDQTGFDLLDQLEEIHFQIIFTTAYDNYAIKAFEYAAVHYLLKPITLEALSEAVGRCAKNELIYEKETVEKTKGFYLRTHENAYDIRYDEIQYIKADGSYSTIYHENRKDIFTSKKLADYKTLLSDDFFRIHHSVIVNMNFIDRIDKKGQNVILLDQEQLPISRRKKVSFKKAFQAFRDKA